MLQLCNEKIKGLQSRMVRYSEVKAYECAEVMGLSIFKKLWTVCLTLDEIDNLKTYLYTVTKNYSLNYISNALKYQVLKLDKMNAVPNSIVVDYNHENIYSTYESLRVILGIPSQCKQIFQLVKEYGLKYTQAPTILNIPTCTVKNQIIIVNRFFFNTFINVKMRYIFSQS